MVSRFDGVLVCWCDGVMGCWGEGVLVRWCDVWWCAGVMVVCVSDRVVSGFRGFCCKCSFV